MNLRYSSYTEERTALLRVAQARLRVVFYAGSILIVLTGWAAYELGRNPEPLFRAVGKFGRVLHFNR